MDNTQLQQKQNTQARKWQITVNNPSEKNLNHTAIEYLLNSIKPVVYYCLSDEVGLAQQTPHTHIYIAAQSPIRFSRIKKLFPEAHIEQARGTSEENRSYIEKSGKWADDPKADTVIAGTFKEWGEIPIEQQGARNDLTLLYELIKDGKSNLEILEANADYLLRLTDIERVRQTIKAEEFRTTFRNMEVTYLWGRTGTGKTRYVMEREGYAAVFRVTDYEHPFDGYAGQETLVLDEFRSQIKMSEMLNLLDGYPKELPCRYANKVACFTEVFIISNLDLTEQYRNIQQGEYPTWEAFLRRIHKVRRYTDNNQYTETDTAEYLSTAWTRQPVDGEWEPPPPLPEEAPPEYTQTTMRQKGA